MTNRTQRSVVIVPCKIDADGKAEYTGGLPYGYHHVLVVAEGGSFVMYATVFCNIPADSVALDGLAKSIADHLGGLEVRTEPDFYADLYADRR